MKTVDYPHADRSDESDVTELGIAVMSSTLPRSDVHLVADFPKNCRFLLVNTDIASGTQSLDKVEQIALNLQRTLTMQNISWGGNDAQRR
jgi:hypothetical protein